MPCQPKRLTVSFTPAGTVRTWTVNTGTDILTLSAAAPPNGTPVKLTTTGALPASTPQVVTDVYYFVIGSTGSTCQLATTPGGSAINFTGTGSGTHSITGELSVILQKHPANVNRVSIRAEENRKVATARTAVGRLKAVASAFPRVMRWTVEAYGSEADKLTLARILEYQESEPQTAIKLKDEVDYLETFKAAQVGTRSLVSASTQTVGQFQQAFYTFDTWMNSREEPWAIQEDDQFRFVLEFRERY